MSDETELVDGSGDELPPEIVGVLARDEVWAEAPSVEDAIIAAIAGSPSSRTSTPPSAEQAISLEGVRARRSRNPSAWQWWLGAAAAALAVVAGAVLIGRSGDDAGGVEVALAATDLAPGARATALFEATPAGLKIVLDAEGLTGAAPGEMYEAWVSDGDIRVSAGTFHLRGGSAPIELWAGTADPAFHIITVTIEPIDGDASSSGRVVLRGEYDLAP